MEAGTQNRWLGSRGAADCFELFFVGEELDERLVFLLDPDRASGAFRLRAVKEVLLGEEPGEPRDVE